MARGGIYAPRVGVPVVQAVRVQAPDTGAAIQDAAGRAYQAYDDMQRRDAQVKAALEIARINAKYTERLANDENTGAIDDGYTGQLQAELGQDFADAAQTHSDNRYIGDTLELARIKTLSDYTEKSINAEWRAKNIRYLSSINEAGDKWANVLYRDPSQYELAKRTLDIMASQVKEPAASVKAKAAAGQLAYRMFQGIGADDPRRAQAMLKGGKWDGEMSPEQRAALSTFLDQRVKEQQSDAYLKYQADAIVASRSTGAKVPDPPPPEIVGEDNHQRGRIFQAEQNFKVDKEQENIDETVRKITSGEGISPTSADDKRGWNKIWEGITLPAIKQAEAAYAQSLRDAATKRGEPVDEAAIARGASDEGIGYRSLQVSSLGVMPQPLVDEITQGLASVDPDKKAYSARLYTRLVQDNPELAKQMPAEWADSAKRIADSYMRKGLSAQEAVKAETDRQMNIARVPQEERNALAARFSKVVAPEKAGGADAVDTFLDGKLGVSWWNFFGTPTEMAQQIKTEFRANTQRYWTENGGTDLEGALAHAYSDLRSVYQTTQVNGRPQLFRNAPENPAAYGVPGASPEENAKWIRQQAVEDVNQNSATKYTPDRVRIISPPKDIKADDGRPAYWLQVKADDGSWDTVIGPSGKPLRWWPDTSKSAPVSDAKKMKQDAVDVARRKREFIRNPVLPPLPPGPGGVF